MSYYVSDSMRVLQEDLKTIGPLVIRALNNENKQTNLPALCCYVLDPLRVLQEDLNTIHPLLIHTPDNEVNSQVQKLLLKIGICQLTPKEVVCQHILPVLKSDVHKV